MPSGTRFKIEKGRQLANEQCGCPIWHAVVRELGVPEDKAKELVEVADYGTLRIGRTTFALPPEAISLQRILVEFPQATIEEMTFVAPVNDYTFPPEVEESQVEEVVEQPKQQEKPSLLERIFG